MAEDENVESQPTDGESPEAAPTQSRTAADNIRSDVKAAVQGHTTSGTVRQRVVDALVEEELGKRVDLLTKALRKRDELYRELQKIKPDTTLYSGDGKQVIAAFNKQTLETRKKATEALEKLDKAIATAEGGDFEPLKKAMGG